MGMLKRIQCLLGQLARLNSLDLSPIAINNNSQLRTISDRFDALIGMAEKLSLNELAAVLAKNRDDFLFLARDKALNQKNWSRLSYISNILMDNMSSHLLFKCIREKDRIGLKRLLDSNALHISPKVVEVARRDPAIHEMIASYLRESTHLIRAASSGLHECVKLSLRYRADPKMKNSCGQTALHAAASAGQPDIIRTLMEHRANPNMPDANGDVPLVNALESGCRESEDFYYQLPPKPA